MKLHRDHWLKICREHPEAFFHSGSPSSPGSIEKLIHELEYNQMVADISTVERLGCQFELNQFSNAISDGTFSILFEEARHALQECHAKLKKANNLLTRVMTIHELRNTDNDSRRQIENAVRDAKESITKTLELIRNHLYPSQEYT